MINTSAGELAYRHFIAALTDKARTRFINATNTHDLGNHFWNFMTCEYKQKCKEECQPENKKAFWEFAKKIKNCVIEGNMEELFNLYEHFSQNGHNYWSSFYLNAITVEVGKIFY